MRLLLLVVVLKALACCCYSDCVHADGEMPVSLSLIRGSAAPSCYRCRGSCLGGPLRSKPQRITRLLGRDTVGNGNLQQAAVVQCSQTNFWNALLLLAQVVAGETADDSAQTCSYATTFSPLLPLCEYWSEVLRMAVACNASDNVISNVFWLLGTSKAQTFCTFRAVSKVMVI